MNQLVRRRDRRLFTRVQLPFAAAVRGVIHPVLDISLGGFHIGDSGIRRGEVEDVLFTMRLDSLSVDATATGRCVFHDAAMRESRFAFINLAPAQAYLFDALCMASADRDVEPGDEFLKYAVRRADRAVRSRYAVAPLAI